MGYGNHCGIRTKPLSRLRSGTETIVEYAQKRSPGFDRDPLECSTTQVDQNHRFHVFLANRKRRKSKQHFLGSPASTGALKTSSRTLRLSFGFKPWVPRIIIAFCLLNFSFLSAHVDQTQKGLGASWVLRIRENTVASERASRSHSPRMILREAESGLGVAGSPSR